VSELGEEYAGRIVVDVRDVNTDEGKAAVEKYGWQDPKHGLVTLSPVGEMVGTLPGHTYGKDEIRAKVEALLAATAK